LPDPDHLAVLARPVVVRAASALLRIPGIKLPSASPARCDGPAAVSFHHRSVQERLVALGVGDPQLIGPERVKRPVDQAAGDAVRPDTHPLRSAGHAPEPGPAHEQLNGAVGDDQAAAEGELGACTRRNP
jgi:hypothetical protein